MITKGFLVNKPLSLTLASNSRTQNFDPFDDQVWELRFDNHKTSGFDLHTTYGLRAREMILRTDCTLSQNSVQLENNDQSPIEVVESYSNYAKFLQFPMDGLKAIYQVRIASSKILTGKIIFQNTGKKILDFQFSLIAEMSPDEMGEPMKPGIMELTNILFGKTGDIEPVLFMTGGPESKVSPHPALTHQIYLNPGDRRSLTWSIANFPDQDQSCREARITTSENWAAKTARIQMSDAAQLLVTTENQQWSEVFRYQNNIIQSLQISDDAQSSSPIILKTRNPDEGYSIKGDGSDYNQQSHIQTILDSWYFSKFIGASQPDFQKSLLEKYYQAAQTSKRIPQWFSFQQRSTSSLPAPFLVGLVWDYYQTSQDRDFLNKFYPVLLEYMDQWFENEIPVWENIRQTGFITNPLFSKWDEAGQGIDISKVFCPDLFAYLFKEIQSLIEIAKVLNRSGKLEVLEERLDLLRAEVMKAWDYRAATFRYQDIQTRKSLDIQKLGDFKGSGNHSIGKDLKHPSRIIIRLKNPGDSLLQPEIELNGLDVDGNELSEVFSRRDLLWMGSQCYLTTENVYSKLVCIDLRNISIQTVAYVQTPGLKTFDHTLLLPLWAGMIEEKEADSLIRKTILNEKRFGHEFGLPALITDKASPENSAVWLPWNYMIIQGMARYGFKQEALDHLGKVFDGIQSQLSNQGFLNRYRNSKTGEPLGEINHLHGLFPQQLLLEICGITILSPWKVKLIDLWYPGFDISIMFQGLKINFSKDRIKLALPNRELIEFNKPYSDQLIEIKKQKSD